MKEHADALLRILVVDDNEDTAQGLAFLFQAWGHEARVVHDGLAAIEAAREYQPEVVVLDIGLPRMDGFEVAPRLRLLPGLSRTLIVATSGYGRDKDRRRAREVGIDCYLVKPFDVWRLEEIIASHRCGEALHA